MNDILTKWYKMSSASQVLEFNKLIKKFNYEDRDQVELLQLIMTPAYRIQKYIKYSSSITTISLTIPSGSTTANVVIVCSNLEAPWQVTFKCDNGFPEYGVHDAITTDYQKGIGVYSAGSTESTTIISPTHITNALFYYGNTFACNYKDGLGYSGYVQGLKYNTTELSPILPSNPRSMMGLREGAQGRFEIWNGYQWIDVPYSASSAIVTNRPRSVFTIFNSDNSPLLSTDLITIL